MSNQQVYHVSTQFYEKPADNLIPESSPFKDVDRLGVFALHMGYTALMVGITVLLMYLATHLSKVFLFVVPLIALVYIMKMTQLQKLSKSVQTEALNKQALVVRTMLRARLWREQIHTISTDHNVPFARAHFIEKDISDLGLSFGVFLSEYQNNPQLSNFRLAELILNKQETFQFSNTLETELVFYRPTDSFDANLDKNTTILLEVVPYADFVATVNSLFEAPKDSEITFQNSYLLAVSK